MPGLGLAPRRQGVLITLFATTAKVPTLAAMSARAEPVPSPPPAPVAVAAAAPAPVAPAPAEAAAPWPTTGAPPGVAAAQMSMTPPCVPSVLRVEPPDSTLPTLPRSAVRMAQPELSATLTLPPSNEMVRDVFGAMSTRPSPGRLTVAPTPSGVRID